MLWRRGGGRRRLLDLLLHWWLRNLRGNNRGRLCCLGSRLLLLLLLLLRRLLDCHCRGTMLLGVLGSVGKLLHMLGVLCMLLGVLLRVLLSMLLLLLLLWRMLRLVLNMLLDMLLRELLLELLWVRLCVLGSMLNRMLGRVLGVLRKLYTRRVALSTPRSLCRRLGRGWLLGLGGRLRLLSVRQGGLNRRCGMVCLVRSCVLWLLMMLGGCLLLTGVSEVHGIWIALPHIGLLLLLLLLWGIVSRRGWMVEIRDAGVVGGARVLLVLGLRRRDNPVLHGWRGDWWLPGMRLRIHSMRTAGARLSFCLLQSTRE